MRNISIPHTLEGEIGIKLTTCRGYISYAHTMQMNALDKATRKVDSAIHIRAKELNVIARDGFAYCARSL